MTKEFTITFAGDTSLGDWYLKKTNRKNELERLNQDPFSFFEGVMPLVQSSDYFILNLETVLEEEPSGFIEGKQYPNYDNPERTLGVLKNLGVTAVSLANNHAMDFGPDVMMKTMERLKGAGIESFGAGKNSKEAAKSLKMELKGEKSNKNVHVITGMRSSRRYREDYGFMASKKEPGVNSLGLKRITNEIKRIRKNDSKAIIIVSPHWQGRDYKWVTPKLEERCRDFLEEGADFVFAHGTHMVNHVEKNQYGTIVYSMGNFIFNSPGRYKKMQAPPYSLIIKLQIMESDNEWLVEPLFYPIVTDNRLTDFNVRKVNELENNELLNILNGKMTNETQYSLESKQDNDAYNYKLINNIDNTEKHKYPSGVNLKDVIMGNVTMSNIDLKDDIVFNDHVKQLKELHNEIDNNFYNYYEKLAENNSVVTKVKRLRKLNEIAKREYLSHKFVKRFERRKLDIPDAFSFRDIMTERAQLKRKGYKDLSWYLDKKINAYPFMEDIGVKIPHIDPKIYKFEEINKPLKPCVIKPVQSTGSMGVYLFFDDKNIFSAREKIFLDSWDTLRNDALEKLKKWKNGENNAFTKDEWMIEELIVNDEKPNSPPRDVKFHCFYGEVLLIQEESPLNYQTYCYWNNDMEMVFPRDEKDSREYFKGKGVTRDDLEIVKQASLKIPTPYIRIDMLKGKNGLVFGEATPRTGKYHLFNKKYDKMLGEGYSLADARLKRDLLKGKKFDEFTNHFKI